MEDFFPFEELVGTTIKEYRLEYLIEQNILGATFLARCPGTREIYQFRLLNGSGLSPEEHLMYIGQFQQEASNIAALQHPVIHPLLEYGNHNGMPYLISSYIPPRYSLATLLKTSGPLDTAEASYYMDTLTSALEYAHLRAIVHGDLTPDVIFIMPTSSSESSSVVVTDIGVAGLQRLSKRENRRRLLLSRAGETGDPKQDFDEPLTPASDMSALGTILYQMLTGYSTLDSEQKEHDMEELIHQPQASYAVFSRRKALSLMAATGAATAITGFVWANQRSGANIASSLPAITQQKTPPPLLTSMPTATRPVQVPASPTSTVIARVKDIPLNGSIAFKIPQSGDPGVLIHLLNNTLVAFNAACTHDGCPVVYNSTTMLLECHCHGSVFDPAKNAAVLRGPARTALPPIQMTVNADGTITTTGPVCGTASFSKAKGSREGDND